MSDPNRRRRIGENMRAVGNPLAIALFALTAGMEERTLIPAVEVTPTTKKRGKTKLQQERKRKRQERKKSRR